MWYDLSSRSVCVDTRATTGTPEASSLPSGEVADSLPLSLTGSFLSCGSSRGESRSEGGFEACTLLLLEGRPVCLVPNTCLPTNSVSTLVGTFLCRNLRLTNCHSSSETLRSHPTYIQQSAAISRTVVAVGPAAHPPRRPCHPLWTLRIQVISSAVARELQGGRAGLFSTRSR